MTTTEAQRARIWAHLLKRGSITDDLAKSLYGCSRLSARIWELRAEHGESVIVTVIGKKRNPHTGRVSRFTERYRYDRPSQGEMF